MSVESNLKNGFEALQFVNKTHKSALGAMYREDTGLIDFIWGEPGTGEKFKHGYGIAHIIAKRDAENGDGLQVASKLIEVIAKGTDTDCQNSSNNGGEYRLRIHYAGYTAVVSSARNDKNAWLLTGWQDGANKKTKQRLVCAVKVTIQPQLLPLRLHLLVTAEKPLFLVLWQL